ncbi:hypothetical protein [Pseudogemmobacter faecipullorum]|uniref:SWIM-type domain-containing protein n=1 Tax=Pseudogemmobacter faecipullorum TaxID=2755041 RepID=A0ABS8CRR7_9RHOB|nr:hypothetical protein [Pseudogemmobacter faecipullorum]MCB5412092.1 hypothetical protein [Pseudogemmobacter faecipullorum]
MTAIRPLWCIMPDHKPLTRALLDARETTPFTGWRIYPYNPATGAEDSSICILNSNEGVEVAKTLKGLYMGAGPDSGFVLALPIFPEDEAAWLAADAMFNSDFVRRFLPCDCPQTGADCEHVSLMWPYLYMHPVDLIGLCNGLTEIIHEDIGEYDDPKDIDEEAFLNHPYAPLREELCEISGYYGD